MIGLTAILFAVILTGIIIYFERLKKAWKAQGIKSPTWFLGQAELHFFLEEKWKILDNSYKKYKKDGMFVTHELSGSNLHICDLKMIEDITVKYFDHFSARRPLPRHKASESVMSVKGERWKQMRIMLSKVFTSTKVKSFFNTVNRKSSDLNVRLLQDMKKKGHVTLAEVIRCFTEDVIVTCTFGLKTSALKNTAGGNFFVEKVEKVFNSSLSEIFYTFIFNTIPLVTKLGIPFPIRSFDDVNTVALNTIQRKPDTGVKAGDFVEYLLEVKKAMEEMQTKSKYEFTENTIASNSVLFVMGSFDTVSATLQFTIYYLAKHTDKQRILRKELEEKLSDNFNYENLMNCHYLEAAISEAMRLHPPIHSPTRLCTKDFEIKEKGVTIKKNTLVTLQAYSLHHDPDYWKDPEEFIPERFLPENKNNIVPFSYMPFGVGPRNCVGMRFAWMQVKSAIAKIFLHNEVELKPGFDRLLFDKSFVFIRPQFHGVKILVKQIQKK